MKRASLPSFCIVIPMHNEKENAAKCIDAVMLQLKRLKQAVTLIVVNDGSRDQTAAILNQKAKQYRDELIVITLEENQGYGGAIAQGIVTALKRDFSFALFMDSDLTNDPQDISRFIQRATDQVDCIKASRYIAGGRVIGVARSRRIVSKFANLICVAVFRLGIHDYSNGFSCIRLSLFQGIKFQESGFAIILEQMFYFKARRARCIEIPVTLTARVNSDSSFRYQPRVFWDYGKYLLKAIFI